MTDLPTASAVAAAVYFVSAAAYGTMVWVVWTHLRGGWRRGWLSRSFVALNRLAMAMLKRTAYYRDARKNLKRHARAQMDDAGRDRAIADAMQRIAD